MQSSKPNYVFFVSDQHRADHLGCYGNSVVQTPNIDRLAQSGTRFEQFYVANPFCMPNRASMMTGRMPSLHRARTNGNPLPLESRTFVKSLRSAGYHTALIGKSHLQNMTGQPRAHTPPEALGDDGEVFEAFEHAYAGSDYENENSRLWQEDPSHKVTTPFYGFDHVDLCTGHGDRVGGEYLRWLSSKHPSSDSLRGPDNAIEDKTIVTPQSWRTRVPEEFYPTRYIADRTCEHIARLAANADGAPFFVQCSFPDPHHPFTPPGRYWDMYDPASIAVPKSFGLGESPMLGHMREELAVGNAKRQSTLPYAVTAREAQEAIALTYGMITMIDDAVGQVIKALDGAGLADNTILVFVSDHGDFMGDHGIMLKGPLHYRGLIRVPFIWFDPTTDKSSVIASLAQSIDIPATFLERSGIRPYFGMQGTGLMSTIYGSEPDEREELLIEDDRELIYLGFDCPQRVRTVVTADARMTVYEPAPWGELYDLLTDPLEINNLWNDPAHRLLQEDMTRRLLELVIRFQDWAPIPTGRA